MRALKRRLLIPLFGVLAFLLAGIAFFSINLSAVEDPSALEAWVANHAKRQLIGRSARRVMQHLRRNADTVAMGGMQFRADCGVCHGSDGRTATEIGKSMSPRASDLGSAEVQAWSDAELFWIIKNGIKMTGMPGFGPVHPDERIWDLVHYVRQIGTHTGTINAEHP